MALIVCSMLRTCPCCTPVLFARPNPRISNLPYSFFRPAIAAILVVPMSRPTIIGASLTFINMCVFVVSFFTDLLVIPFLYLPVFLFLCVLYRFKRFHDCLRHFPFVPGL